MNTVIERETASTPDGGSDPNAVVERCEHGQEWVVVLATGRIHRKPCRRCARFAPPTGGG